MSEEKPKKNPSLIAKSNARQAAVQLIYRLKVTGENLDAAKLAKSYEAYLHGGREAHAPSIAPHKPTLQKLLEGVQAHGETLDGMIDNVLNEKWSRARMSPLLVAILELGFYELDASRNVAVAVLVDEYTRLAQAFCDEEEVSFVHAAMQKMARHLRG